MRLCRWPTCEHIEGSRFFLPTSIFAICLNFQQQNPFKNQYLLQLSSGNCEINSIKSGSLRVFQQHQKHPQIPIQLSVLISFSFHWENGSIINSFHTIAPNSLSDQVSAPLLIESFLKIPKSAAWSTVVWKIWAWQNKTNYLACFIDTNLWVVGSKKTVDVIVKLLLIWLLNI